MPGGKRSDDTSERTERTIATALAPLLDASKGLTICTASACGSNAMRCLSALAQAAAWQSLTRRSLPGRSAKRVGKLAGMGGDGSKALARCEQGPHDLHGLGLRIKAGKLRSGKAGRHDLRTAQGWLGKRPRLRCQWR